MAKTLSYKIVLFNARGKRVKSTHLAKAHFIEIYYGKRKILAKTKLPKVYFSRKKKVVHKKKYLKSLIEKIEKKRLKAIEKRRKTIRRKKRKIEAKKRKRAVRRYRKKRIEKAKQRAKKIRSTKRQKEIIEEIKSEEIELEDIEIIPPKKETESEKVVIPIEYDDYTKEYKEYSLFSKKQGKELFYKAVSINEKDPIAVTKENIHEAMKEMRERYFPHFVEYIKSQGDWAIVIPKFEIDFNINPDMELSFKKDQRLDKNNLGISIERTETDVAHAKEVFELLLEQFFSVLTGRTNRATRCGGDYLARSQNNVIYVTGFTTESSDITTE